MNRYETQVASIFRDLETFHVETGEPIEQLGALVSAQQYRYLYRLTEEHAPAGSRVLDWGCGRGHFSYYLASLGLDVTAYAFGPPPRLFDWMASRRSVPRYVPGSEDDPVTLPFEDGSFDAVFSVGVLEHVRETGGSEVASLGEIRRILRPGGRFVCFHFPNRHAYIEAVSRAIWGRKYGDIPFTVKFHKFLYTPEDIERLCDESGLSLLQTRRYSFLPRNMFSRMPGFVSNSRFGAVAANRADGMLERLFPRYCTNNWFVAEKPDPEFAG